MTRLAVAALLMFAAGFAPLAAGDEPPTRAKRLETLRAEFEQAGVDFRRDIRNGKIKPDADGRYAQWAEMVGRFSTPARDLALENPGDATGLEVLLFSLTQLGAEDADLYALVLKHHPASKAIDRLVRVPGAPDEFRRAVAETSPDPVVRLWAKYHLAESLADASKSQEAVTILEALGRSGWTHLIGGYSSGTMADSVRRLSFAVRDLAVGQVAPDLSGPDLDEQPLKLSDSRGKVTLVVFWATWCGPCMNMVPHERKLLEAYAGRPFAIVGVNGDNIPAKGSKITDNNGKDINAGPAVREAMAKLKMTWPSFHPGYQEIAEQWGVRNWPTIYLLDHDGVIRHKWKGDPGAKELDAAVEKLVRVAEGKAK